MLVLLLLVFLSITNAELIIEINDGQLRGEELVDLNGAKFYSFRSVPYAKPPLKNLRFKDPVPVEKWSGIQDATDDMPLCLQRKWNGTFLGQEDCLYLNVHTPEITTDNLKPVMVFIHGGSFVEGSGCYGFYAPEFLIIEDVVVVTINYRLGVLGFLSFDNQAVGVTGNAALKDQLMALKWVKQNIDKFGGDPDQVTLFGQSAGGANVHLHLLSPKSQVLILYPTGLFQRAISMSGSALNAWCNGVKNTGPGIGKKLGFEDDDEVRMLKYMQGVDAEHLLTAVQNLPFLIPMNVPNLYGPIVEKFSNEAFLTDLPRNILKSGNFNKIPYMLGLNDEDGMLVDVLNFVNYGKYYPPPVDMFLPYYFKLNESQKHDVSKELKKFYFNERKPTIKNMIDLQTDGYFTQGIYETLFAHAKQPQEVYFYLFSSDTKMNFQKRLHSATAAYKGACHGDELGYLFKNMYTPEIKKDSIEDKAIRLTVKLFANFAKYGKPVPSEQKDQFGIDWAKMDGNRLNYINIENDKLTTGNKLFENRAKFWCTTCKKYAPDTEFFCNWTE